jgi:allantoin racemase
MSGYIDDLKAKYGLPIIEPMACAINMAITLVNMGLSHSKFCYESLARRRAASTSTSPELLDPEHAAREPA